MSKQEFLKTLAANLDNFSDIEIREIISDYEEHFQVALHEGKTEQEISASLGSPIDIAAQYQADNVIKEAKQRVSFSKLMHVLIAVAGLGLINLLIAVPVFVTVMCILLGFWAAVAAVPISGMVGVWLVVVSAFQTNALITSVPAIIAGFLISFGTITLGLLFIIGMIKVTQFVYWATLNYLQMNLAIIRKQEET